MSPRRRDRLTPEAFHELDEIPDVLVRLLRRCWDFDFHQRPNVDECTNTLNSILDTNTHGEQIGIHLDNSQLLDPGALI